MNYDLTMNSDRVFIIAEVGLNHNGMLDLAKRSIEAAADVGVDAVKFQNYRTEDFIYDRALTYTYKNGKRTITESMWDLCKRCEMRDGWIPELKKLCDLLGIQFLSTPTSESGVKDLVAAGIKMLKNGSDFLTHVSLLKYMGSTGLPVIISTGMADCDDIQDAVNAVREGGESQIILLHCTSTYPTNVSDVNLRRMIALRRVFNVPIGFSDHTIGSAAAVQAVTLGACMVEKHFTLDHKMRGPDHWFSLEPIELKHYVSDIRDAEKRMGRGEIVPSESEKISRKEFRLSIIASKDLKAGQLISRDDFVIAKPGAGLPPKEAQNVIGREIRKDLSMGTPITWQCFK